MNNLKMAAALRLLAEAFETPGEAVPETALAEMPVASTEVAKPRGRGRPPKDTVPAAPAAPPAAVEADPFAATVPVATLDDVRAALTTLKDATSQDNALAVLKAAGGVSNLSELQRTPDKYGYVVQAAKAAIPAAQPAVVEVDDPFETKAAPAPTAPPAKPVTLEDVKAACVAAGKRTGQDKVTAVVMQHGGRAPNGQGGEGPSLKALPPENYAALIAAVAALPTTK